MLPLENILSKPYPDRSLDEMPTQRQVVEGMQQTSAQYQEQQLQQQQQQQQLHQQQQQQQQQHELQVRRQQAIVDSNREREDNAGVSRMQRAHEESELLRQQQLRDAEDNRREDVLFEDRPRDTVHGEDDEDIDMENGSFIS